MNGSAVSMIAGSVPSATARNSTCSPAMWCAGSVSNQVPVGSGAVAGPFVRCGCSPPVQVNAHRVASADAVSADTGSRAPLGVPVDPDVPITTAVGSAASSSTAARAAPPAKPVTSRPASAGVIGRHRQQGRPDAVERAPQPGQQVEQPVPGGDLENLQQARHVAQYAQG